MNLLPCPPIVRQTSVLAVSCGLLISSIHAATVLGPGHADLRYNVNASGDWSVLVHHDGSGSVPASDHPVGTDTLFYLGSALAPSGSRLSRPAGATWDFLGVPAGSDIWVISQTQSATPNTVWLGLNTEETSTSSLLAWDPAHTSVGSGKWLELRLRDVTYTGSGTNNQFALWVSGSFGTPNVWMDTSDGIATNGTDDVFYMAPGQHSHMNWAFTSEGIYDLTFDARTLLADGTFSISDPFTLRFGVNSTGAVPEPGKSLLALLGLCLALLRRRR